MIYEDSEIIRQGLSMVLASRSNDLFHFEFCDGNEELQYSIVRSKPKVVIASPSVLERNDRNIKSLKEKIDITCIALIYSYNHPDELSKFDGIIYINDQADRIRMVVSELLNSKEGTDQIQGEEPLTKREKEILKLLVSGNTTKQIASTLHISSHTVNAHRKNIMKKLDIKTVSGLTIYAVLNNIINLKEA